LQLSSRPAFTLQRFTTVVDTPSNPQRQSVLVLPTSLAPPQ